MVNCETRSGSGFHSFYPLWHKVGIYPCMEKMLPIDDLDILQRGLRYAGARIAPAPTAACNIALACHYRINRNGSVRWIWPARRGATGYLKFYYTGSRKAALMATAMRTVSAMGADTLTGAEKCTLYIDAATAAQMDGWEDWALFTGTIGENRKLIVWYKDTNGSHFAKIPLSAKSMALAGNEVAGLNMGHVPGMVKPTHKVCGTMIMVQNDIWNREGLKSPSTVGEMPIEALGAWLSAGAQKSTLKYTEWWQQIKNRMANLPVNDSRFSPVLLQRLQALYEQIWVSEKVLMTASHGDFTPWNLKCDDNNIYAADWEMYAAVRPAMYDLFHFVYQNNILVERTGYMGIRNAIETARTQQAPAMPQLTSREVIFAEKLYLLDVVSYYAERYARQPQWHQQAYWLLHTWNEAMGDMLVRSQNIEARGALLQDITDHLYETPYAVLKLPVAKIEELPAGSDLDLCMTNTGAEALLLWLQHHHAVKQVRVKRFSFMYRATAILADNSLVHIDCIWEIKRKELVYMDAATIAAQAQANRYGVKTATAAHEARYIELFYLLNHADVPQKYQGAIGATHNNGKADKGHRTEVINSLKKAPANRGLSGMRHKLKYMVDTLRQMVPVKGQVVTFSGVDGAGKSTVIDALRTRIEKELRSPVVVLRHRPSILPILSAWRYGKAGAEQRSVSKLPRTGTNNAGWSSGLRFAYYYTDYLLGQFYVQARYVWRGYTVLYDRYYFDFINDARRSNIEVPRAVSKWLYRFLVKPQQNYFLFAPAATILQRKQELDAQTIEALTDSYLNLFADLQKADNQHAYHTICNTELPVTLNKIFDHIKNETICAA